MDGVVTGETVGETIDRAAGETAGGAVNEAISKVVQKAVGRTVDRADNRATGKATNKVAGKANSEAANGTVGIAFSRIIVRVNGRAIGGAAGEVRTIRIWTDIMIILTNLSVYVLKLEKENKYPGNSFFYNYSTNINWNANFARHYLQLIDSLRLVNPLLSQVYSVKLFKESLHA